MFRTKLWQYAEMLEFFVSLFNIFVISFQGIRFMRRFKQLLNPAQVFDLSVAGPTLG